MIRRISVSVAVDYKMGAAAADAPAKPEPRSQAEMQNIRRLLQGGVGFDVQRGDTIEVVSVPFTREEIVAAAELPIYEQEWFMRLARLVAAVLVIIVLIIFIVRPMLKKLIYPEDTSESYDEMSLSRGIDLGDDTIDLLSKEFDAKSVGFAADGTLMLPDLHGDEDLLKAVRALVANEPELSSLVVKNWLAEDE